MIIEKVRKKPRQLSRQERNWRTACQRLSELQRKHPERSFSIENRYEDIPCEMNGWYTEYCDTRITVGVPRRNIFGKLKLYYIDFEIIK
jgi:hypothetical protein